MIICIILGRITGKHTMRFFLLQKERHGSGRLWIRLQILKSDLNDQFQESSNRVFAFRRRASWQEVWAENDVMMLLRKHSGWVQYFSDNK
jgi:hypothetical protein